MQLVSRSGTILKDSKGRQLVRAVNELDPDSRLTGRDLTDPGLDLILDPFIQIRT